MKNTYKSLILTSIITAILITSGIGVAYAADTEHSGSLKVGSTLTNVASGENSVAFGYNTTASGNGSFALGKSTIASGFNSLAHGFEVSASGSGSRAFGHGSDASGTGAFAYGHHTVVESFGGFEIGQYNELLGGDPSNWVSTDPQFVIGNGVDNDNRHNAVTVLKNGNFGIGVSNPNSNLEVKGYIELDTSSGKPPATDCDSADEIGRMKVDDSLSRFYICADGLGQPISWKTGVLR